MNLGQVIRLEASRIEEWTKKYLEERSNKPEEIEAMMHAQLKVIVKRLRKLSNRNDRVINGISEEMDKLEHQCEAPLSADEKQIHIDNAVTNVRRLIDYDGSRSTAPPVLTSDTEPSRSSVNPNTGESLHTTTAVPTGVLERLEAIVHSLRRNTKEVGTGTKKENDNPRTRNLCVMTDKLAEISLGNADRLEYLVRELRGQVPSSELKSRSGSPKINPISGQTSSSHQDVERTASTTTSSGSPTSQNKTSTSRRSTLSSSSTSSSMGTRNLAEDVRKIIRSMNELEMAVATPKGLSRFGDLVHDLAVLVEDLENPEVFTKHFMNIAEHFMNTDTTENVHIYKLWEEINCRIQDDAKEDCLGDAQRIHLTKICEQTLESLASDGNSDEQEYELLMKVISGPRTEKCMVCDEGYFCPEHSKKIVETGEPIEEMNEEGESISHAKAPWLKDPELHALKDRIAIGHRHGGKNILTTIKEAEAFLSAEKELENIRKELKCDEDEDLVIEVQHLMKTIKTINDERDVGAGEILLTIQGVRDELRRSEKALEEEDLLGQLSSSGKERLARIQGVDIAIGAILQRCNLESKSPLREIAEEEEHKIFKTTTELAAEKVQCTSTKSEMAELRGMVSLMVRKIVGLPKDGTIGGIITISDINDYAQKIGLIQ